MEIDKREIGVTGMKQVLRGLDSGQLCRIYLAEDADASIKRKILDASARNGVETVMVPQMRELGRICGIEVGAACAGVLRN